MHFGKTFAALLLGAASAAAINSASHAADAVSAESPAAFNWSGIYVGFGGGVGAALNGLGFAGADLNALGGDGVYGELTVGYDHMLTDRLLIGAFADARFGNVGSNFFLPPDSSIEGKYGFDGGFRLGYLVTPTTLGFVSAGYSWQHFELTGIGASLDWNADGYFAGAGIETVLTGNWTLKSEYRYANYGTANPFDAPGLLDVDSSTHTFTVAANYRFGGQNGETSAIEAQAYNWTGFYVGGAIGAGAMVNEEISLGLPFAVSGDGVFAEASIGYDHEFGEHWVLGALVDGRISGISSKSDFGGSGFEFKSDYGFDVLARGGVKLSATTLAYALVGYSWQHFKAEPYGAGAPPSLTDSSSGFVVGAGLEAALTDKTALNLEYRYAKYGNVDFGTGASNGIEPDFHTIRVGAKYKFN
ncbi:outer membrane protein [Aminobacter niigataensis]|uniref:outer membrane protein n=1 Tax=Aminobacter niigataensis TaxID=83265 RepID=UPI0024C509FF|nr:outer membrane beta-barrel protein [Aminobacter niigataensis]CAI2934860.1 Opacity protein antigen [Aminobacter niigataensis]